MCTAGLPQVLSVLLCLPQLPHMLLCLSQPLDLASQSCCYCRPTSNASLRDTAVRPVPFRCDTVAEPRTPLRAHRHCQAVPSVCCQRGTKAAQLCCWNALADLLHASTGAPPLLPLLCTYAVPRACMTTRTFAHALCKGPAWPSVPVHIRCAKGIGWCS